MRAALEKFDSENIPCVVDMSHTNEIVTNRTTTIHSRKR
jgi:hypothetical protein